MSIYHTDPRIMWSDDLFLRKPSRALSKEEVLSDAFREIIKFLFEALYEDPSGVGLAAPQVGLQIQVAVIDLKRDGKKPIVLINPEYSPIGDEKSNSSESCLSFKGYSGIVERFSSIIVTAKDLEFNNVEFQATGFKAFVCQHEIDHLSGKVYVDKAISSMLSPSYCTRLSERALSNCFQKE